MTPSLNESDFISTNKTLTIGEVTGKKETDVLGLPMSNIEDEDLKAAMVKTFIDSGIFKEVFIEKTGGYQLSANIISQKIEGGFSNTLPLVVRYNFIENESGKVLWEGNLFSQKSLSVTDEFAGAVRTSKLREITIQDNLNQLVMKIQGIISKEINNK
jgi:hypothetical protein